MAPKPLLDEAQPFKLVKPDRYRTGLLDEMKMPVSFNGRTCCS